MGGYTLSHARTVGIYLSNSSMQNPVTITNTGNITVQDGYGIAGAASFGWTVTNYGTIQANNSAGSLNSAAMAHEFEALRRRALAVIGVLPSYGIRLDGSGAVTNSGYISAVFGDAVLIDEGTGTVVNSGTISEVSPSNQGPAQAAGIRIDFGGAVFNSGSVSGFYGISSGYDTGAPTITNSGVIVGQGAAGIVAFNGGSVTNRPGGSISGDIGISLQGSAASTVVNAGTISGSNGTAAVLFGGGNDSLVVDPGAVFVGNVDGGGSLFSNTLELAAGPPGTGTGTLAGLGTSFVNFGTVMFDAGASWIVTLPISEFSFPPTAFTGTISGFAQADIIDLTGLAPTGLSLTYSGSTLAVRNGVNTVALSLPGSYSSGDFHLSSDGNGGTEISLGTPPPTATSDFNGDGKSDILFQNTNGQAAVWLINGTAPISEPVVGSPDPSWHVVGAGDFYGGDQADILWQNTNGQPAIWVMNGTTPVSEPVVGNPGPSWKIVGTGDFNGGGDADILWQNTSGQVAIWVMNGTTPMSEPVIGNPGPSWHVIGTGDFNGDGQSDILFQNDNGQVSIWLMSGTTPTAEVLVGNPGPTWHIHAAS